MHRKQIALLRALEEFHRHYAQVDHACSELGFAHRLTLGRNWEYFVAALGSVRWDDADGRREKTASLEPLVAAMQNSLALARRLNTELAASEASLSNDRRTEQLNYAMLCAEREADGILVSVRKAQEKYATEPKE